MVVVVVVVVVVWVPGNRIDVAINPPVTMSATTTAANTADRMVVPYSFISIPPKVDTHSSRKDIILRFKQRVQKVEQQKLYHEAGRYRSRIDTGNQDMSTRRESIEKLLEDTEVPLTARDICERLGITGTSEIFDDIEHISQTIRIRGKEILIRPARCAKCGYVFWNRHVAKMPAKCPKCHSEQIMEPGYIIKPGR